MPKAKTRMQSADDRQEDLDERRFPRAVAAKQPVDLPGLDGERHAPEGVDPAIGLGKIANLDGGHGRRPMVHYAASRATVPFFTREAGVPKFRIEQDTMGPVRVPADAVYGAQTQRAVENFPVSGLRFPRQGVESHEDPAVARGGAHKRAPTDGPTAPPPPGHGLPRPDPPLA